MMGIEVKATVVIMIHDCFTVCISGHWRCNVTFLVYVSFQMQRMGHQAQYKIFIAVLMSLSIVAMHYISMEALVLYSRFAYNRALPDGQGPALLVVILVTSLIFAAAGGRISAGAALRRKKQTIVFSQPWRIGQSGSQR